VQGQGQGQVQVQVQGQGQVQVQGQGQEQDWLRQAAEQRGPTGQQPPPLGRLRQQSPHYVGEPGATEQVQVQDQRPRVRLQPQLLLPIGPTQ